MWCWPQHLIPRTHAPFAGRAMADASAHERGGMHALSSMRTLQAVALQPHTSQTQLLRHGGMMPLPG